jgi:thiol:disulfide interchange protein
MVSAVQFSFGAPDTVSVMEPFDVDIGVTDETIYDVKIFFKAISETLPSEIQTSEGWKNAYYYLKATFPQQHIYTVRLKQYSSDGETKLCVRLRKQNQTSYVEECKRVDLEKSSTSKESNEESEKKDSTPKNTKIIKNLDPESATITTPLAIQEVEQEKESDEPIILRASGATIEPIITKQAKTRIFINYVLALVALIALFIIFKRNNREF